MSEEKLLEREVKVGVQDPEGSGGGQVRRRLYVVEGLGKSQTLGLPQESSGVKLHCRLCVPRDNDPRQQSHFPASISEHAGAHASSPAPALGATDNWLNNVETLYS